MDDDFLYEDKPKKFLRVWAEYGSSGIWVIDQPMQQKAGKNISYEDLNLPLDLINDFSVWQERFDNHGIEWNSQVDEDNFYSEGLELAKRLKEFMKYKAYIEYKGDIHTEIKYYYVSPEYCHVSLWNDEHSATNINLICEDLDITLENKKELNKEFYNWSDLYDQQMNKSLDLEEFNKIGYALSVKFESYLPKFCKIGYLET